MLPGSMSVCVLFVILLAFECVCAPFRTCSVEWSLNILTGNKTILNVISKVLVKQQFWKVIYCVSLIYYESQEYMYSESKSFMHFWSQTLYKTLLVMVIVFVYSTFTAIYICASELGSLIQLPICIVLSCDIVWRFKYLQLVELVWVLCSTFCFSCCFGKPTQ